MIAALSTLDQWRRRANRWAWSLVTGAVIGAVAMAIAFGVYLWL